MQNDGYIIGTTGANTGGNGAFIALDGIAVHSVDYRETTTQSVSIYAPNGSTISTRSNGGTYDLTVYEWK